MLDVDVFGWVRCCFSAGVTRELSAHWPPGRTTARPLIGSEEGERHQIFPINHLGLVRCEMELLSDGRRFRARTWTRSHSPESDAVSQHFVSGTTETFSVN